MKRALIALALLGATTAAAAVTLHQYDGVAIACTGPTYQVNIGCGEGTTHFDLWLRDDMTLDRVVYSWDRPDSLQQDFSASIDRNNLPSVWRTEIVTGEDGVLRMNIWDARWRVYDGTTMLYFDTRPEEFCTWPYPTGVECIGPMPKSNGLSWTFTDYNNWSAYNGSQPYEARLGNGIGRMGLDSWWMIRANMELTCSSFPGGGNTEGCFPGPGPFPASEPGTLALLGAGLAGLALARRRNPSDGGIEGKSNKNCPKSRLVGRWNAARHERKCCRPAQH